MTREEGIGRSVVRAIDGHRWKRWTFEAKLGEVRLERIELRKKGIAFDGLVGGTLNARFTPDGEGGK